MDFEEAVKTLVACKKLGHKLNFVVDYRLTPDEMQQVCAFKRLYQSRSLRDGNLVEAAGMNRYEEDLLVGRLAMLNLI